PALVRLRGGEHYPAVPPRPGGRGGAALRPRQRGGPGLGGAGRVAAADAGDRGAAVPGGHDLRGEGPVSELRPPARGARGALLRLRLGRRGGGRAGPAGLTRRGVIRGSPPPHGRAGSPAWRPTARSASPPSRARPRS